MSAVVPGLFRCANPLRAHLLNWATVGEVLRLWENGAPRNVRNLGSRRVGEIITALIAAGFTPAFHGHG